VKEKKARAKKPVDYDAKEVRPDVVKPGSKNKDVSQHYFCYTYHCT
jgi:hypothetical protein